MTAARELDVFSVPLAGVQLVEASAGTGKTWTLCALVLRLLLERGLRLPEILLVTFTTAATAELRERVRLRLVEAIAHLDGAAAGSDPLVPELLRRLQAAGATAEHLRERLNEALLGFDEAAIHTIHGFAQRSLAELAFAAGERSEWEAVQDESGLRLEVAQAWWREQLVPSGAQAPLLLDFLRAGGDTPERFAEQLGEHLRLPLARCIWPPEAEPSPHTADEASALLQEARTLWAAERGSLRGLLEADLSRWPTNIYKPEAVASAFEEWDALLAAPDALLRPLKLDKTKLKLLRRSQLDGKLKQKKVPLPAHPFPPLADALIEAIEALQQQLDAARRALRARWLQQGRERLACLKAERGLLGYDDMLQRLHAQLQQPAALAQLQRRYPAALIDEFQDTDPLQFALFKRLQPPCCFFVGDPKQAIYRFRQADLPTYLQARAEADAVWTLTHNQRSTPELLEALNALFGCRPDAFLQPGLHYLPVQAGSKRKPVLTERTPSSALQLWSWTPQPAKDARHSVLSHLAADIARRLHPEEGDRLDDAPLQPRHIAVLVRTHRQAAWVVDALRAVGVEAVALAQGSVWASPEAQELQQLLEALLGPPREDRQRALLATVALGLDAEALVQLSESEAEQLAWAGRWRRWRELAQERLRERAPAAFLHAWLQDSGAAQRLLALPQGERRLSNWLHAIELLQQQVGHSASPSALLAWLRRQRHERGGGEDALLRLESDAARVQVITVHRSKGLEFPIVYLPFAHEGESGRRGDKPWALRWRDDAQQQVLDYAASELSPAQKATQALEDAAEAVRLHYVGLTRAALRCVVSVGLLASRPGQPASRYAPLHALVAHDGQVPWPEHQLENADIEAFWAEQGQAPHTALRLLDGEAIPEPLLRTETAPQLAARTPPSPLPALRWVGSFSRLIQPGHGASPAASSEPDSTAEAALAPDDFLRFPRGSLAGDCLHAALEHALLAEPSSWPPAVQRALAEHPPELVVDPSLDAATHARWTAQLLQALRHAAQTPLALPGAPLRLAELPAASQRREWAFHLDAPQVDLAALPALLARHGLSLPGLRFTQLRGLLRGFVDLVFEHEGRYHLADWKSNHLGFDAAAYRDPSPTVAQAGYALQALLYQLALHRHLRHTVPGYTPERHLGSALLLFVRGMRPDFPAGSGQWRLPTDLALLHAMDRLFS